MTTSFNKRLDNIRAFININVASQGIDSFVSALTDTMDILLDEVIIYDDDEVWESLKITRTNLLGPVSICEYKNLLVKQIKQLLMNGKDVDRIIGNLSTIEKRIALYPDDERFSQIDVDEDRQFVIEELQFRAFTRDPRLKAFDFGVVVQQCCTPCLLFVPLAIVLDTVMIGPYLNNPIGYHTLSNNFYVLSEITAEGARLWILDYDLEMFTQNLEEVLIKYIVKTFRTFYKKCFSSNKYKDGFEKPEASSHYSVFSNILSSLRFVCDRHRFHMFLVQLIMSKSYILPTKHDFFNSFASCAESQSYRNIFEDVKISLFD
jgi:hypothetical protein